MILSSQNESTNKREGKHLHILSQKGSDEAEHHLEELESGLADADSKIARNAALIGNLQQTNKALQDQLTLIERLVVMKANKQKQESNSGG